MIILNTKRSAKTNQIGQFNIVDAILDSSSIFHLPGRPFQITLSMKCTLAQTHLTSFVTLNFVFNPPCLFENINYKKQPLMKYDPTRPFWQD